MVAYETPSIEMLGDESLLGVQGEAWSRWVLVAIAVVPAVAYMRTVAAVAVLAVAVAWAYAWRK